MKENSDLSGVGNELISNYRESSGEELRKLELVVGTELLEYLQKNGLRIYIHKTTSNLSVRNTNAGFDLRTRMGFVEANYIRNDYAILLDGRVVMFCTFLGVLDCEDGIVERVVEIDYAFIKDWNSDLDSDICYRMRLDEDEMGGSGLYCESLVFMRKLKKIVMLIPDDRVIQICVSDKQRKRLYKRALANRRNVRFVGGKWKK